MRRRDFTNSERSHVVQFLLEGSINGKMVRGRRILAMAKFNSSKRTISRIWSNAKQQQIGGSVINLKTGKSKERKKRVHINLEQISSMELHKRGNITSLSRGVGCSRNTVWRWVKRGLIRAHTSALRPELTAQNKLQRVKFSLEALELDNTMNVLNFKNMYNTVHIDEKWFYITKGMHRFYLTPEEADPHRTCKSKKFITKVMFMCAVSRPLFVADGTMLFDGKIGMFPFTYRAPAKRGSKNRPAGTMETRVIDSITKDVVRECLINKILPAIRAKWPAELGKHIYIQQDNARPHIKDDDSLFRESSIDGGFTLTLVQQPPNSSDTNVNDLGWFHAIQALQNETCCNTIDELVQTVQNSFDDLSATKLNNVFLSLQGCMLEIMKLKGENRYKVPHIGKEAMIRAGTLPLNLEAPAHLVRQCLNHLKEAGGIEGLEILSNRLGIDLGEDEEG